MIAIDIRAALNEPGNVDRPWLIAPETGHQLSYDRLRALATRLDVWFHDQGIGPGAIVAMLLPNGLTASALFIATMATGRVIAPLSLLAQPSQLAFVLDHCDPAMVFTTADRAGSLRVTLNGQRAGRVRVVDPDTLVGGPWGELTDAGNGFCSPPPRSDDDALLMYTSGTTGSPKGVPLTHGNLLHSAAAVARWHDLGPRDRVLSALPLYHINGQVIGTLTPLLSHGSLVAPRRFSVSGWWQAAMDHRCTWLNMVPTIIAYLLNEASGAPNALPAIRFGRSASAPLPPDQQRAFEQRFGIPIIEAMGMTESASVVFCNPMALERRRIGSPGLPIGVEVKVVDDRGRTLGASRTGEIWLRGPTVMRGYFRDPERTAEALTADGWLRSGDLGHLDADGYAFITGRLKELIIKGGENIAPREIDEALLRHPDVLEAAAVGIPHPAYGQDILAAVVPKAGVQPSLDDLRAFCERELGRYKTPARFVFLTALPKGPSGKVQRLKLLDDLAPD
ncbi:MAG: AMP-binding protein [Burkholderiaceae bacterium]